MPARAKLTTNEITQSTISVDNFAIGDEMSHAEMDSNFLNLRDQTFGIVGDDSTGIDVKAGDTIKFLGQGATSVAVIGNQVVISSTDTGGGGGGVTSMRFVGDDSTGVTIGDGETLKITGAQNISVIATQDTVTITGPDLTSFATASSSTAFTNKTGNISQWTNNSGYLTNSTITIVGDDSTGTTLNTGETIKFAGAGGAAVAVSGDTVTITAGGGASQAITFVGDDSTGTAVNPGETFKIAGVGAIETSVSGDTLSLSLSQNATAITIVGDDSTGSTIKFADTIKFAGAGTVTTAVVNDVVTITGTGGGSANLGDLLATGSTLTSSITNGDVIITGNGTGAVELNNNGRVYDETIVYQSINRDSVFYSNDDSATNQWTVLEARGSATATDNSVQLSSYSGNIFVTSPVGETINLITPSGTGPGGSGLNLEVGVDLGARIKLGKPTTGGGDGSVTMLPPDTGAGSLVIGFDQITSLNSNQNITITPNGTGSIVLDGLNWPQADGTNGQILSTNGAGQLSFITNTSSTGDIVFTGNKISTGSTNANLELSAAGTGIVHVLRETLKIGTATQTQGYISSVLNMSGMGFITTNSNYQSGNGQVSNTPAIYEPFILLAESDIGSGGGGGGNIKINTGYDVNTSNGGSLVLEIENGGYLKIETNKTGTTIGANGAAAALTANPVGYLKIFINGSEKQIPYYNV